MEIIWTENARLEYFQNLEYLETKWSAKVASKFMNEVDEKLELLISNHFTFPKISNQSVQKFIIIKLITIFYLVEGEKINLLHFWNNNQNPEKLSL